MASQTESIIAANKGNRFLGILFIASGFLLNKWSVERLVTNDEHLSSFIYAAIVVAFELFLIGTGLWLVWKRQKLTVSSWMYRTTLLSLGLAITIGFYGNLKALRIIEKNPEVRQAWDSMVASEELIVILQKELKNLLRGTAAGVGTRAGVR